MAIEYLSFVGFDWDDGNRDKNLKHDVHGWECEQLFFNNPLIILDDMKHSDSERRYAAFGQTDSGRRLVIVYTMRGQRLRVISARDMNKKERAFYESYE
jgi:uncharacterized DUF497 family protein